MSNDYSDASKQRERLEALAKQLKEHGHERTIKDIFAPIPFRPSEKPPIPPDMFAPFGAPEGQTGDGYLDTESGKESIKDFGKGNK